MSDSSQADRRNMLGQALQAIESLQARLDEAERARTEPIAIVGLSCRFPGAPSARDYWQLLQEGRDAVREVPADRWDKDAYYDPDPAADGKMHAAFGGFLDNVDSFDAAFFGITGREAETMDPQQRLLLEVSWEALEDAGIAVSDLRGSRSGVFVGITTMDYARLAISSTSGLDVYTATGGALNVAAGRIAYTYGFNGPAMAVDTACSSSLVALHLACQSLRSRECDMALAGGVNVLLTPEPFVCFAKWGMMAPDGRCKTFDERADGFVRSEGCGLVVLKRLSDAVAAGDRILALVSGTAVNQDGASSGLTVPNGLAQQAVVRAALQAARIKPEDVDYIEAHGTGTTLGDPIELEALAAVLGKNRAPSRPLRVGSVKTNIGHAESASGIAGLIKVVLSLQHEEIPRHLHFRKLNPKISLLGAPIEIPTAAVPWTRSDRPRTAGVSSFGFSGTNAHAVLQEAPAAPRAAARGNRPDRAAHLLVLSARSENALRGLAGAYAERLSTPDAALADIAHSAAVGRQPLTERLAIVAADAPNAARALQEFAKGGMPPSARMGRAARKPNVAFLYTGQGSQYVRMGHALYETEPVFRAAFDRCADLFAAELDEPLARIVGYEGDTTDDKLQQTSYAQPALFAVEYALTMLWNSWGIVPAAVMGHSLGELTAACVAGALTLEDAVRLVAARARLMQSLPANGAMTAVLASEDRVRAALETHARAVAIAAVNGPQSTVVSGLAADVEKVVSALRSEGVETRPLAVSHAFHSPLLDPILDEFERRAAQFRYQAPQIEFISNVTGAAFERGEVPDAKYWRRHAREAVRFADSIRALAARGIDAFLEVGPAPVLLGMGRLCAPDSDAAWLASLRKDQEPAAQMASSLGELFVRGAQPRWRAYDEPFERSRVDLPHYAFQRKRFWLREQTAARPTAVVDTALDADTHPLLGRRLESPLRDAVFECVLDSRRRPILAEHKVAGLTVVPAAAFIELGSAAGRAVFGADAVRVENGWLRSALVIDTGVDLDVRLVLTPEGETSGTFEVYSRPKGSPANAAWTSHAGGRVARVTAVPEAETDAAEPGMEPVDIEAYRRSMADVGLEYGASFSALVSARRADGRARGTLRLPPDDSFWKLVGAHPGMLDAAFHLIGLALGSAAGEKFYLPVGYEAAYIRGVLGPEAQAEARIRSASVARVVADVTLRDANGAFVGHVTGLEVRPVSREQFRDALGIVEARDDLLEVAWRELPAKAAAQVSGQVWHVLGADTPLGAAVARALAENGASVDAVATSKVEEFARRLAAGEGNASSRVVDLRLTATPPAPNADTLPTDELARDDSGVASVLGLLRGLSQAPAAKRPRVYVATVHARGVRAGESPEPMAAMAWGMAAAVAAELPDLDLRMVDLDGAPSSAAAFLAASSLDDSERRVAVRDGKLYAERLVTLQAGSGGLTLPSGPYGLAMRERGTLTGLAADAIVRRAPAAGEVEIEVSASGLNFRDVLNLLDMYPGPAGALGNECCGRVTAVGPGVRGVAVGDLVTCIAEATFASHVIAKAELAFPVPPELSAAQAATFPIAQLTAYLALHETGRMKASDWVLVHAGAGGVGLAAVHLALAAGAKVIATAGSEEKREYLRALGVQHVFDSRRTLTAAAVREATSGHGVDLLLNSLTGDAIDEGLRSLAPGGRFLEIGLRELRTPEAVRALRTDVEYHTLLLGDVCKTNPAAVRAMYDQLVALLKTGRIPVPRVTTFAWHDAGEAFTYMAKARHIGRIALMHRASAAYARPDGAYVVSGGLGALGLSIAGWLVARGARHLVLLGRSAPTAEAQEAVNRLQAAGANVEIVRADVADRGALSFLQQPGRPPIRGVIHTAGVVDDAMLASVDTQRLQRVVRPKADGAVNLAAATENVDLDFFVMFSSASAVLGSAGQTAYAAANAFLDAFARRLRTLGRAAVSVNWGAWAGGGMAARVDARTARKWAESGVLMLSEEDGLRALEAALASGRGQVVAAAMDWPKFFASLGSAPPPALLVELAPNRPSEAAAPQTVSLQESLRRMPAKDRRKALEDRVTEEAAVVLGVEPGDLDRRTGLTEQGVDSLLAVELANRLGKRFGVSLGATLVFECPTLIAISAHVHELLGLDESEDAERPDDRAQERSAAAADADVAEMSADEASAALLAELGKIGY